MHYYKHNIGDYRRRTAHLTPLEHGVYRQALDQYYLDEGPLTSDITRLERLLCVSNADEKRALCTILDEFFCLDENGYRHPHADNEIDKYHKKSDKASAAATIRWGKHNKKQQHEHISNDNADAMQTHNERNANHKPLTTNHKPTKDLLPENLKVSMGDWFELNQTNSDWINDSGIPDVMRAEIFRDFVDYWKLDGGKKTKSGWQMAFRKNPIIKRKLTNFKHNGAGYGAHQKDTRSRAEQFSDKLDEIARRSLEEEAASGTLDIGDIQEAPGEIWPQMDIGHGGDRGGGSR